MLSALRQNQAGYNGEAGSKIRPRGNKKRKLLTWSPKDKEKVLTRCKSHSGKLSDSVISLPRNVGLVKYKRSIG